MAAFRSIGLPAALLAATGGVALATWRYLSAMRAKGEEQGGSGKGMPAQDGGEPGASIIDEGERQVCGTEDVSPVQTEGGSTGDDRNVPPGASPIIQEEERSAAVTPINPEEKKGAAAAVITTTPEKKNTEAAVTSVIPEKKSTEADVTSVKPEKSKEAAVTSVTPKKKSTEAAVTSVTPEKKSKEAAVTSVTPEKKSKEAAVTYVTPEKKSTEAAVTSVTPEKKSTEAAVTSVTPEKKSKEAAVTSVTPEKKSKEAAVTSVTPEKKTTEADVTSVTPEKSGAAAVTSVTPEKKSTEAAVTSVTSEKSGAAADTSVTAKEESTAVAGTSITPEENISSATIVTAITSEKKSTAAEAASITPEEKKGPSGAVTSITTEKKQASSPVTSDTLEEKKSPAFRSATPEEESTAAEVISVTQQKSAATPVTSITPGEKRSTNSATSQEDVSVLHTTCHIVESSTLQERYKASSIPTKKESPTPPRSPEGFSDTISSADTQDQEKHESCKQVLVLGLDGSGKTSVLNCISAKKGKLIPTPTEGVNAMCISNGNSKMEFLEIGGSEHLRPYWKMYLSRAFAVIFVVDSADHSRLSLAKRHLHQLIQQDPVLPLIVLANKQDLQNAHHIPEIHDALALSDICENRKLFLIGTYVTKDGSEISSGIQDTKEFLSQLLSENSAR